MMQSAYAKKQQDWTPSVKQAYFYLAQMMEEIEDPEATISYYYKALEEN